MTFERLIWRAAAVATLAALLSCAPLTTVRNAGQEALYSPSLLRGLAAADGGLALRVVAPAQGPRWEEGVRQALAGIARLPFASLADDRGNAVFRLLAVIDAPVSLSADRACGGGSGTLAPVDGRSHVLVALCHGDRAVARARAVAEGTLAPASDLLARAVEAAALQAFPPEAPGDHMPEQIIIIVPPGG